MDIRILPSSVANMIAAGEVVQRPSSVVKELVENAVDAGATKVTVIIRDAGRTLIQVIDDGSGMTPDEAVLCFERHATSKLRTAEDLGDILTFGFRGEALASIAAVAQVSLKTRPKGAETGCKVEFADSKHISTETVSCPEGSSFSVRDLFYNIPARRKFLKSDNVEFRHIVEEFTRVALTRPDVAFTLIHNDRDVFVLRQAKSEKYRIQDLLGSVTATSVVDISADTSVVNVRGYISRPDLAKKTLGNQFFFVNGRYFRSPYLHKAVMKAYEGLLSDGAVPAYFIFLTTDPHSVDVNISPTKTEIKFEDEPVVFQVVYACVREALGRNSFGTAIDFDTAGAPEMPVMGKTFDQYHPDIIPPSLGGDPSYNPFEQTGDGEPANPFGPDGGADGSMPGGWNGGADGPMPGGWNGGADGYQSGNWNDGAFGKGGNGGQPGSWGNGDQPGGQTGSWNGEAFGPGDGQTGNWGDGSQTGSQPGGYQGYRPGAYGEKRDDYGKLFDDRLQTPRSIIILGGKYILSKTGDSLMVVNIRRARERIFYERFLKAVSAGGHCSQTSLFPVQVTVGVDNRLVFDEHAELLRTLGFDISPFGNDTIVVNGVPEGFSCDPAKVEALMADVLLILNDEKSMLPGAMDSALADKFARTGAATGRTITSPDEAGRLVDTLLRCENPMTTGSGRRVLLRVNIDDIDKKF